MNIDMTISPEYTRQLAAVMFADIAGYTAFMQKDEKQAIAMRNRQRQVLEEKIREHGGQVRQYYGDGALINFSSAVEAVLCAIEVQQELGNEPQIPVRIGIHMGDVVIDSEGVYGDAVNVASRIESLSDAGAILISDKIERELRNHPEVSTRLLGSFDLKNVKEPVEIYAVEYQQSVTETGNTNIKWEKQNLREVSMELVRPYMSLVQEGLYN